MDIKTGLLSARSRSVKIVKRVGQMPVFVLHHPFKTFKICFRTFIIFVLLCYLSAYVFPRPLDYLVATVHYIFFGSSEPPNLEKFIKYEEPAIGEIFDAQGKEIIKLAKEYRRINNYSDFPELVVGAVTSTEDRRFFSHNGIDYWALFTSVPWDVVKDTITEANKHRPYVKIRPIFSRGGSTLTQQAVRLHLLSEITKREKGDELIAVNWRTELLAKLPFMDVKHINTILRKIKELRNAIYLEQEFRRTYGSKRKAKEEIFARYASSVYLGSVYGIGYGSEFYFGKRLQNFKREDIPEAAFLAGMIKYPLPRSFSIKREIPEKYIVRKNEILRLMAVNGFITNDEASRFMKEKITFFPLDKEKTAAPSVVSDIRLELNKNKFSSDDLFKGFIRVNSTVDLRIQNIANQALENGLAEYEKRHSENRGLIQGSVVILRNSDAAILAEIGGRKWYQGREYRYSDLNRVNRVRPVGSVFKAFDYFTAFTLGKTPDDIIVDAPFGINRGYGRGIHPIHNYDGKYIGAASLKDMLKGSRNIPAVKLVLSLGDGEESGMAKVEKVIKTLGIKSPLHSDIDHKDRRVVYVTSALGASEMNVLEIANAYRGLATGIDAEPYMVREVINREGKPVFVKEKTVLNPLPFPKEAFEMIQYCLRRVVTQPGGTAYSLTAQKFPIPIAGKTGTTDDFRNAWFAGFTYGINGITVVARVDFDDNRNLAPRETGSVAAMPIVREIFLKIYEQNLVGPVPEFPSYIENGEFLYQPKTPLN